MSRFSKYNALLKKKLKVQCGIRKKMKVWFYNTQIYANVRLAHLVEALPFKLEVSSSILGVDGFMIQTVFVIETANY